MNSSSSQLLLGFQVVVFSALAVHSSSFIPSPGTTWSGRFVCLNPSARYGSPAGWLTLLNGSKREIGRAQDRNDADADSKQSGEHGGRERRKNQVAKAAKQIIQRSKEEVKASLLDKLNPYQAGQNLRKSLDSAISSLGSMAGSGPGVLSADCDRSPYFIDDRFKESGGALFMPESNPYLAQLKKDDYVPDVLVVGAKGEVGRLVVKRLLLEGRSRVRVLVPDLYSDTLNILGTGVVYYQGGLNNLDSLETALTDVDKIVHISSAPQSDEEAFLTVSSELGKMNSPLTSQGAVDNEKSLTDLEWESLESALEARASLAREIDFVGMQNLVRAYQNVRFADYGTSQAAKRSLFKFHSRTEDFNVFMMDDDETEDSKRDSATLQSNVENKASSSAGVEPKPTPPRRGERNYVNEAHNFDVVGHNQFEPDSVDESNDTGAISASRDKRQETAVKTQVKWIRNSFGQGVFVGKVAKSTPLGMGGEASIISCRLGTRNGGPEDGINLSGGFGGFVCRLCADGAVYEAYIRDAAYDSLGIEYVCEFSTASKAPRRGNASRNKFVTVRLPFESFKPVRRRPGSGSDLKDTAIPAFTGRDVRYLGFRYRSARNLNSFRTKQKHHEEQMSSFYMALSYIKLYRIQPEPEFVYLSDARIPPVVLNSQVRHDLRRLVPVDAFSSSGASDNVTLQIMDDWALQQISVDKMARSPEETYYKFRGEEVLKGSGLSYAIIRVAGYNEAPSSEASTIDLKATDYDIKAVSRAEVAQVCVSALLDPNANNKCFYCSKKKSTNVFETISEKFSALPTDISNLHTSTFGTEN